MIIDKSRCIAVNLSIEIYLTNFFLLLEPQYIVIRYTCVVCAAYLAEDKGGEEEEGYDTGTGYGDTSETGYGDTSDTGYGGTMDTGYSGMLFSSTGGSGTGMGYSSPAISDSSIGHSSGSDTIDNSQVSSYSDYRRIGGPVEDGFSNLLESPDTGAASSYSFPSSARSNVASPVVNRVARMVSDAVKTYSDLYGQGEDQ